MTTIARMKTIGRAEREALRHTLIRIDHDLRQPTDDLGRHLDCLKLQRVLVDACDTGRLPLDDAILLARLREQYIAALTAIPAAKACATLAVHADDEAFGNPSHAQEAIEALQAEAEALEGVLVAAAVWSRARSNPGHGVEAETREAVVA